MKEVTKFKPEGFDYLVTDTAEKAKDYERQTVLSKYLDKSYNGDAYNIYDYWEGNKALNARNSGYRSGYSNGRYDAIADFLKFYSDIKPKLNAIDNQITTEKSQ